MTYKEAKLLQIAMPMGGIGAGCVCLNGFGALQDFSIYNKPSTTAQLDHWNMRDCAFAILHVRGANAVTKLLEGPLPEERVYNLGLHNLGHVAGGYEGMPRFEKALFTNHFPFGTVHLSDPEVPVQVDIEGWSPFIPNDDRSSGMPAAVLNYTFINKSNQPVDFAFSYHLPHLAKGSKGVKETRNQVFSNGQGILLSNSDDKNREMFGTVAVGVGCSVSKIKAMWFRGGWWDAIATIWRDAENDSMKPNDGSRSTLGLDGRNGGSLQVDVHLAPGETKTVPIVLAWHFPNPNYNHGVVEGGTTEWHPWYTTQWNDAEAVATDLLDNLDSLQARTRAFANALWATDLPDVAVEAIASNLAILKSPTLLRQSSGNMWNWEGCFTDSGSCHGSCTHVWNYAQALPHLFPALERTLREQEYCRSMDDRGHINFRSALPDGPTTHNYHAASDGQLGGIMKLWRDWQISGDTEWLKSLYPRAKRSLDYCIRTWDPDHIGVLIEPHHNTYDIEFWGPDGMCSSIYLGALCAMDELASAVGQNEPIYAELAAKCADYMDTKLFNGEYYEQHVQWEGLHDQSFANLIKDVKDDSDDDVLVLLKHEGPKYQYGTGCISDGVIGAWMARLYGIETPLNKDNVRSHLSSIFRYNYRQDLFDHACLQRPTYAMGHERGLLLCTWPKGGKPTLPFVYSDEVWTGIEYQVASHSICVGLLEEGTEIVDGVRSRYEGHTRNPFNEIECGNYYARALASYALLQSYTGFRYSAVTNMLELNAGEYTTFFSTASGFGTISVNGREVSVNCIEGELLVDKILLHE